ncbi:MAG: hypothetical protein KF780_05850 [Sphingomonas sp.]|nr:hypothetical protein [Sphingomonas sp.]
MSHPFMSSARASLGLAVLLLAGLAACGDERPLTYRPPPEASGVNLRCGGLDIDALARDGRLQVTPAGGDPVMLDTHRPAADGSVVHAKDDMRLVRHHDGRWTMHDGARAAVSCEERAR